LDQTSAAGLSTSISISIATYSCANAVEAMKLGSAKKVKIKRFMRVSFSMIVIGDW
jgi:hypothetical protein